MTTESELASAGHSYLYPNYRQPPFVFVRGEGSFLFDASGKRYLDLYAGIAVSTLGHAHPKLSSAIAAQAGKLLHVSNYFYNEPNVRLAEKLCRLTEMDRAFFCNSGTEAIEATLKLARRYFHVQGQPERQRIIAFRNSFHGRTLGALAATGQDKYKDGFGPLPGVTHVPYGDLEAVRAAMGPDVAGILVEPVQGEGGVLPAPPGFLRELTGTDEQRGLAALGGRSANRHWPHRQIPGVRTRCRPGGRGRLGQGARRRRADRRDGVQEVPGRGTAARQPWLHLRRQPARLGRGAGGAGCARERWPPGTSRTSAAKSSANC